MKFDMSYSTCEPLPELQDKRDCKGGSVPGSGASTRKGSSESRNSGSYFPQISRSKGCSSAESNYNDDGTTGLDSRPHSDNEAYNRHRNTSRTSRTSSVESSRKGSPAKLPQINVPYHKSKSVTSLCSNKSRNKQMIRAEMCRSPSCPSLYSEYEDPGLVEQGDLNASIHHHHSRKSTGDAVKLPEIYDGCDIEETPQTARNSYDTGGVKRGSRIDKELQKFSMRKQREEEARRQMVRKTHRQQQLDRQSSQPTALLLPIRKPNRAKKDRQSESSIQSYHSAHSVQSDSGVSTSLRQSDTSDASNRAEESEWSGWEEGEGQRETEEEEEDEYEDAEEDDPGYEEEDEYEDAAEGETYYNENGQEYYNDGNSTQEENQAYYENNNCKGPVVRDARHRRYKVARSQDPVDYQPPSELDSTEKCQEWLHDRRRGNQQST